jgi:DNA-binding HxlR family transcriptional regulator
MESLTPATDDATGPAEDARAAAMNLPGRPCSIASALYLVGERWSLLAVREIMLGNRRFDEIARNTGAPRDRIAARLKALQAAGVVERRQYQDRPARYEYFLTPAGKALGPVVDALRFWGDRWVRDDEPMVIEHDCGHPLDAAWSCRHCGREVRASEYTSTVRSAGWTRSGPIPPE